MTCYGCGRLIEQGEATAEVPGYSYTNARGQRVQQWELVGECCEAADILAEREAEMKVAA